MTTRTLAQAFRISIIDIASQAQNLLCTTLTRVTTTLPQPPDTPDRPVTTLLYTLQSTATLQLPSNTSSPQAYKVATTLLHR
ncbi:hypothetical protein FIBSPDRAFT_323011 [Athelia psychrophila]|uniref:Uncharacterized protein n=1 Tax=Athelia psychrophila TaxID=1759441 RepID=A0A167WQR7_9AGAM|nr:hypothetical protein FIBSPDRAFT_323011 [Fibularhizoctonia sp. CBS 109695]